MQPAPEQAPTAARSASWKRSSSSHAPPEQPTKLHVRALARPLQPLTRCSSRTATSVDLGQMCNFDIGLGSCISCNISYDLLQLMRELRRKPPKKNLYADIDAAKWQVLHLERSASLKCTKLSCLPPSNILLSVSACDELAADTSFSWCALVSYHQLTAWIK